MTVRLIFARPHPGLGGVAEIVRAEDHAVLSIDRLGRAQTLDMIEMLIRALREHERDNGKSP